MSGRIAGRAKAGSHALPPGEYAELLAKQDGHCALCPATPKTRKLHTDRDHKTGLVRGLLCMRCNRALPSWITTGWLDKAWRYLDRSARAETLSTPVGEPVDGPA